MAQGPCLNPNCKSHGRPHPNCLCYSRGPGAERFAHGGCVSDQPHEPGCEYYAEGGPVGPDPEMVQQEQEFQQNPDLAVDRHVLHSGLHAALTQAGHSRSPDPHKPEHDFRYAHERGRNKLPRLSQTLVAKGGYEHHEVETEPLKKLLEAFKESPERAMEVGGSLGQSLPAHAMALTAKLAVAQNYLESIKPKPQQTGVLDPVSRPSKFDEAMYERQVQLVQSPAMLYKHAVAGRIQPQDLKTLATVYPKLLQEMKDKAFEALASHKREGGTLHRKQREGLSYLLGQPLSYVQTPMAAQAILKANAQPQPSQGPQKAGQKASGAELNQINKVNKLDATPLQARQINSKS
jgi:hypothetical protein